MKYVAFILALVASLAFATPADATRPGPPTKPGVIDRCWNIPGNQPAYMLVGTGPYRYDLSTPDGRDCISSGMVKQP